MLYHGVKKRESAHAGTHNTLSLFLKKCSVWLIQGYRIFEKIVNLYFSPKSITVIKSHNVTGHNIQHMLTSVFSNVTCNSSTIYSIEWQIIMNNKLERMPKEMVMDQFKVFA
jgi:hypothetical protein